MTQIEAEELMYQEMQGKGYPVARWSNVPTETVTKAHIVIKSSASGKGKYFDRHTVYVLGYVPDLRSGVADIAGVKEMEKAIFEPYFHKNRLIKHNNISGVAVCEQMNRQAENSINCQLVSVMFYIEFQNFKF